MAGASPARNLRAMKRVGDLELEQDLGFERRSWRTQRVLRWLLLGFVACALAGVFGSGPFDRARAADASGQLRAEYPRFARRLSDWELALHVGPEVARGGEFHVWLDRSFMEHFQLERALPEPERMSADGERLVVTFRREDNPVPALILVQMKARSTGRGEARLGLVGGPEIALRYFVYP